MPAYYNENDPKAAAWLRELIAEGHVAPGHVDSRSIADVRPDELVGFSQCHFFAGIGGWSLALRLAGWDDERPVWTGSCPCQPFSASGEKKGCADARHLWPVWFRLIEACRPAIVFGEQVASSLVLGKAGGKAESAPVPVWFDGISDDLEGARYTVGAADIPGASVGSPHIRQRLYWMAYTGHGEQGRPNQFKPGSGQTPQRNEAAAYVERRSGAGRLAYTDGWNASAEWQQRGGKGGGAGAWGDFDILPCRDGKSRRVESGLKPLAPGLPRGVVHRGTHGASQIIGIEEARATAEARTMRLRGYGNSIVPELAAEFVLASMEVINETEP